MNNVELASCHCSNLRHQDHRGQRRRRGLRAHRRDAGAQPEDLDRGPPATAPAPSLRIAHGKYCSIKIRDCPQPSQPRRSLYRGILIATPRHSSPRHLRSLCGVVAAVS